MIRLSIWVTIMLIHQLDSIGQHAQFINEGKIKFEKKVNTFALLKKRMDETGSVSAAFYDNYRRQAKQFETSLFSLNFSPDKSHYSLVPDQNRSESILRDEAWIQVNNEVFTDLARDTVTTIKNIYGQKFVVKDKEHTITWKLTSETREIAGFQCRRANGLILDSLYVVAFYTEQIMVSGGPEGFNGLPGMILGVALPHENVSWFATEIMAANDKPAMPAGMPPNSEVLDRKQLELMINENIKTWQLDRRSILKALLL